MPLRSYVEDLTDGNLDERIANAGILLVVEFWDPWCSICAEMAPVYETLARKHRGKAIFARLNMRDNKVSPDKFQVYVTPTFIFFQGGKELKRVGGLIMPHTLEDEMLKSFPR